MVQNHLKDKDIEEHIRIKDPQSHKTNLLEFLDKVVEEKDIQIKLLRAFWRTKIIDYFLVNSLP